MTEKLLAVRMPACRSFVGHKSMGAMVGVADGWVACWWSDRQVQSVIPVKMPEA